MTPWHQKLAIYAIDCMLPLSFVLVIQVNINIPFQIRIVFLVLGCFNILEILPEEVSTMSLSKKAHSTTWYGELNVYSCYQRPVVPP